MEPELKKQIEEDFKIGIKTNIQIADEQYCQHPQKLLFFFIGCLVENSNKWILSVDLNKNYARFLGHINVGKKWRPVDWFNSYLRRIEKNNEQEVPKHLIDFYKRWEKLLERVKEKYSSYEIIKMRVRSKEDFEEIQETYNKVKDPQPHNPILPEEAKNLKELDDMIRGCINDGAIPDKSSFYIEIFNKLKKAFSQNQGEILFDLGPTLNEYNVEWDLFDEEGDPIVGQIHMAANWQQVKDIIEDTKKEVSVECREGSGETIHFKIFKKGWEKIDDELFEIKGREDK